MRWKYLLFICTFAVLLVFFEGAARVYSHFQPLPENSLTSLAYEADPWLSKLTWTNNILPHPYFGFTKQNIEDQISEIKNTPPDEKFVVVIVGGSVAQSFGDQVRVRFAEKLKKAIPALAQKNVAVYNFAIGAGKQPQQFYQVSYVLDHIDMVISLDGLNEVEGFSGRHFLPAEAPAFSALFFANNSGNIFYGLSAKILKRTYILMNFLAQNVFTWSHSFYYSYRALGFPLYKATTHLQDLYGNSIYAGMRDLTDKDPRRQTKKYLNVWSKYLTYTNLLTKSYQVRYFAFTQPNQYLPGSKVFSEHEKSVAFSPPDQAAYHAQNMKMLREETDLLKKQGLPVFSLMEIFKDHPEEVYTDDCCHLNEHGNDIMEEKILQIVAHHF